MNGLSALSDEELMALYQQAKPPAPAQAPAQDASPLAGMSDEDLLAAYQAQKQAPQSASTLMDVVRSAGTGLTNAVYGIAGMQGDAASLGNVAGRALAQKVTGVDPAEAGKPFENPQTTIGKVGKAIYDYLPSMPSSETLRKLGEPLIGPAHKPETTLGDYTKTIAEFAPAAALPGGAVRRAVNVLAPALGSETAGQMTKGTDKELYARLVGALVGGAAPFAGARAVTPFPAAGERARLVGVLENEGVNNITAGQRTGSNALRYAESALGDAPLAGGRAQAAEQAGREQFTRAATRRAGMDDIATSEALQRNQTRLGNEFERISQNNALVPDRQFVTDMTRTAQNYVDRVLPSQRAQGRQNIETIMRDVVQEMQANGGQMPGRMYQDTRSRLSKMADGVRQSDPQLADAIRGIRDSLDDAFARSLPPAEAAALETARRQYGAQKVLEKAASRAGEATGEGLIVPANLRNVVAAENRGRYARGQGDFADLARAGATVMQPMPQSGTGPRAWLQGMLSALGAGAGGMTGDGSAAMVGALVGAGAPAAAGRALMSRPVQAYLGNNVLPAMQDDRRQLLARALLALPRPEARQ